MNIPRISVLLSVYNGEKYLREAAESILRQTFADFELIIIDDGSTDQTPQILDQILDPRIIRLKNDLNLGLSYSLNKALAVARGELIARMDADDVSLPRRLAMQFRYLAGHPEIGVLGTAMQQTDSKGRVIVALNQPREHETIVWKMFFETAISHPTVMMRRDIIRQAGGYNPEFLHVEDTELWSRLMLMTRFANLVDILYLRRLHAASVMSKHWPTQNQLGSMLRKKMMEKVLGRPLAGLDTASLQELCEKFSQSRNLSAQTRQALRDDLQQRIRSRSRPNFWLKTGLLLGRRLFSAPLRHRLSHTALGQYLTKIMR
ncbi:MAG: glycosyltransferase [Candidatus Doudnabacteria bacterium]|nr:glycosyltransferase [Candidatus Doudnabacteria bacterium]